MIFCNGNRLFLRLAVWVIFGYHSKCCLSETPPLVSLGWKACYYMRLWNRWCKLRNFGLMYLLLLPFCKKKTFQGFLYIFAALKKLLQPTKDCSSKFRSKHSTALVLCLLRNLLEQSLSRCSENSVRLDLTFSTEPII